MARSRPRRSCVGVPVACGVAPDACAASPDACAASPTSSDRCDVRLGERVSASQLATCAHGILQPTGREPAATCCCDCGQSSPSDDSPICRHHDNHALKYPFGQDNESRRLNGVCGCARTSTGSAQASVLRDVIVLMRWGVRECQPYNIFRHRDSSPGRSGESRVS